METIQRQPMVETGRIYASRHNRDSCHCLVRFLWDWHDIGGRPANLPPDVGTYITNNELVGILILLWVIVAPILSCVISYITKLIIIYHVGEKARH